MTLEKLYSRCRLTDGGCLEYMMGRNSCGYGWLGYHGRQITAHRLAWLLYYGSLPDRPMEILHDCDNPACCNVEHLRQGSHADNMRDMSLRQRTRNGSAIHRGYKHHFCKVTPEQVAEIRDAYRNGESQQSIARSHALSQPTVWRIVNGVNDYA